MYDTSSEVDININAMLQRLVIPDVDMAPVLPKVKAVTVSKRRTYRYVMLKIREKFQRGVLSYAFIVIVQGKPIINNYSSSTSNKHR